MQMGCIMRPYFRGGARILLREVSSKVQQVVLCEGAARMYVQHFANVFSYAGGVLSYLYSLISTLTSTLFFM